MPESKPYHFESLANWRTQVHGIHVKIQQDQRDTAMLQSMILFWVAAPTDEHKPRQMPVSEPPIGRLREDNETLHTQYRWSRDSEKGAEISLAVEGNLKGEEFQLLDAAGTPKSPSAPSRPLLSLAGLIGGP